MNSFKQLSQQITEYKKRILLIYDKKITISQFLEYEKYLSSKKQLQTPFYSIWKYEFTDDFKNKIINFPYEKIIPSIINITNGIFNRVTGKFNMKGPCCFYSYHIIENDTILYTIHFVICFKRNKTEKDINNNILKFAYELILFCDIKEFNEGIDDEIKSKLLFMIGNSDDFPQVKFDKLVLSTRKNDMFFSSKSKNNNIQFQIDTNNLYNKNFPLGKINLDNKNYFDSIKVNNRTYELILESEDFEQEDLIISLKNEIENTPFHNLILNLIEDEKWGLRLSNQEKNLVKDNKSFILSGRPGTGKTTVILIKLFSIFFNFLIKKSIRIKNDIDWNFIQKNIKQNDLSKQFRIVFTSLSQNLCYKVQEMFRDIIQKNNININLTDFRQEKFNLIHSFRDINEYPLFINFRKLLFLIDGSLTFQFFKRKNLRVFQNLNSNCSFEYSIDTIYECNNYSDMNINYEKHQYSINNNNENEEGVFYSLPQLVKKCPIIKLKEANENTFIHFYHSYLKNNKNNLSNILNSIKLEPLEIYSQIYSVIKGSLTSHFSKSNCITKEEYLKKGKKLTDLPNLETIYDLCIEYENWKKQNNYFDIQDLINHIIREVKLEFYDKKLIDYIFIDEIQDLTISQVYLLILLTENPKIFAGDTCQTISSTNRFRFSDLKNVFYILFENIKDALLSLNYRLNSKLLKLSTFISYLIREMFPNTLDKFKDDFSVKITNFKPVFLMNLNSFIKLLSNKNINNNVNSQSLTFSYYHCFICRDDISAKKLSQKYNQNIFTIDILKSKGLEYEIVIIYNFFTESKYKDIWNLVFRKLKIKNSDDFKINGMNILNNVLDDYELNYLLKHNELFEEGFDKDDIKEKIIKEFSEFIYPELNMEFDKHKLFGFCSELKQFYVIITRAITFLIFYEDENKKEERNEFYNFCIDNNFIDEDSGNFEIKETNNENENIIKEENNINTDKNINNEKNKNINNEVNKKNFWEELEKKPLIDKFNAYFSKRKLLVKDIETFEKLANKEYYNGNYTKSSYLFKKTGDEIMFQKSEIFELYEEIKIMRNNPDKINEIFENINNELIDKIKELDEKNFSEFKIIYADCLINIKKYEEAIQIYEEKKEYEKCAKIYFQYAKNYKKAFEYFNKYNNIDYACKCLIELKKYEDLFNYANKKSDNLGLIEYNKLYNNYAEEYFLNIIKKDIKNKLINAIQFPPSNNIIINDKEKLNCKIFIPESYINIDTYYKKIYNFFYNYTIEIKKLLNENIEEDINNDEKNEIEKNRRINNSIKELISNPFVIKFIDAFYYKNKKALFDYIINQTPEIYFYKTNDLQKSIFFKRIFANKKFPNFYYQNLINCIKEIQKTFINAEIEHKNFIQYSTQLLLFNGYIKPIQNLFNYETNIIINAIISNEEKMNELKDYFSNENYPINIRTYVYFSYFKNYIIKNFKNKNLDALENYPLIKNTLKIALVENEKSNNYNITFDLNNLKKFNNYLYNKEIDNNFNTIKEIIEIGCEISLKLMILYIQEREINIFNNDITKNTFYLFKEFYKLIDNIFSFSKKNQKNNNKEIILYSLFTFIGILPLPNFKFKLFNIYSDLNFCIMNSFNLLSNFYDDVKSIKSIQNYVGIFDNEGNNLIINQNDVFNIFMTFLKRPLKNFFNKIYDNLEYPLDYFNTNNLNNLNEYYYFPITYYFYYINDSNYNRNDFEKQITNLCKSYKIYPFDYEENTFNLYIYILSLFFYEIKIPKTLIHFCSNSLFSINENKNNINKIINNVALILLFIEDKWNIKFNFEKNILSNFNVFFYPKDSKYNNILINATYHLKENDISPLIKIIWCKNLLNYILRFIGKNFNEDNFIFYDFEGNKIKNGKCILCDNNEFYNFEVIYIFFKLLNEIYDSYIKTDKSLNEENYYGWNNQFFNLNILCIFMTLLNFTQNIEVYKKLLNYMNRIKNVISENEKPKYDKTKELNLQEIFIRRKQLYYYQLKNNFILFIMEVRKKRFKSIEKLLDSSKEFIEKYKENCYYLNNIFKKNIDLNFIEKPYFVFSNDEYERKIKLIKYNINEEFDDIIFNNEIQYDFNITKENESIFKKGIFNNDTPREIKQFIKGNYLNDTEYLYDFIYIYTHYNIEFEYNNK